MGEKLEVFTCQLERFHQLPILRISAVIKSWLRVPNLRRKIFRIIQTLEARFLLSVFLALGLAAKGPPAAQVKGI